MRSIKVILLLMALSSQALANTMSGTGYILSGDKGYYGGTPQAPGVMYASSVGDYYQAVLTKDNDFWLSPGPLASVWSLAPWLLAIDPASGYNIAPIRIKISGANFLSSTRIKLSRSGYSDIQGYNLTIGASEIYCDFNIAGADIGFWDVVVEDLNGLVGTLPNAFEVKTYNYDQSIAINSPNPFDPARETTTIMYKLPYATDVIAVIFSTTAEKLWQRTYPSGFNGGRAGDNSITWNGINDFSELASNGLYLFRVIDRASGRTMARGKVAVIRR